MDNNVDPIQNKESLLHKIFVDGKCISTIINQDNTDALIKIYEESWKRLAESISTSGMSSEEFNNVLRQMGQNIQKMNRW